MIKNVTLKLTLISLISCAAFLPQQAQAMNWKKIFLYAGIGAGLMYIGDKIIEYNQTKEELNEQLLKAAKSGDLKLVENCIYRGADINARNMYGENPLIWACYKNNTQIAKLLIESGADINAQDNYGETPLIWACYKNNTEIATLLIESGADINAQDNDGQTPLIWACCRGNTKIATLLIESGADINAQDNSGRTAYDYASQKGYPELADYLLNISNEFNIIKNNPLRIANSQFIKHGHLKRIFYNAKTNFIDVANIFSLFQKRNKNDVLKKLIQECQFYNQRNEQKKKLRENGVLLSGNEFEMTLNLLEHQKSNTFTNLFFVRQ